MFQIKTTPEIDNAYAAGKMTKQEYYFKCRTMNPLLDDTLALLRDKDIASHMDTLDRGNGAVNPNNYKYIFYENIKNDAIGLGVAATLLVAPYIANGAAMAVSSAVRGGRYLATLTYTSFKNLLKAPMPTTIGGNVAFTLGVSSFYDYMKQTPDPKNNKLAKLGFDMSLNRSSFSLEDKDFLKNLFAEERIANIEEQRKLFEKFNETLEQGLGNIVQHQMLKEKAQQDEREKLATFQNSITVFTYFIGKIDPELGRAVNTIANVGMNIVKLATNVTKMGLGFVVGMVAAILPIFDLLLGGDNEDIAQKRHEEVMESLKIISKQLITIYERMNQRFDLLHDHLQRIELQMAKNFHSIFLTLGEMNALLRNIASDIANTQYSIKGSIVEIKTKLENLITTVQILDSERYVNDLKREQSALELYRNIKYNSMDVAKSFNIIFAHANNTSYLSSFIGTVMPSNALDIFGQNVLNYMHYANNLASFNENEKLPNIPEFCRAVDMLIYYSILFSNEPDIHKITRLADLQLKITNIQKALKKATAKSLIQRKHSEYVNAANQAAEAFIEAMRNIEVKHFGSFSIPTMYSSFLLYKEPSVYLYTSISDTSDVISDIPPISIFREDGGYVTTGVGDNNIVEMLKKLGILNITYGSKLSNEEKSKFQVDEQHESACYVTFDFRNSVDANIGFPLAGFSPECIAIKSYTEGKVVFCVDVRDLKNKIITKLDTSFFVSRSSALFNRKLEELNFVQLLYLNVDFFVYQAKKSIAIEARKSIEYNDVIKKFEKAAADFLYLTTLNRVCTNPISVYKHIDENFQGHDNNNELGYLIDYTEQLYTLADIEYLAHSYLNNNSNEDYALQNPTDSVISAISSIINNKIKDSTTIMGNVGNPEEYCCPPVLQEVINRLTIYVKMQSTEQ